MVVERGGGGGRKGRKELRRKSKKVPEPSACTRAEHPENDCSCETQKGSRGFSSQKGP